MACVPEALCLRGGLCCRACGFGKFLTPSAPGGWEEVGSVAKQEARGQDVGRAGFS